MKNKKYCVGVIWFNPNKKAISQLNELYNSFDKIYIYDNSPKSNKSKINENLNKKIIYLFNGKNEGISKAFNQISDYAVEEDFLFALDQDTEIKRNQIEQLKFYINKNFDSNVCIYCPEIVFDNIGTSNQSIKDIDFTITSCSMINLKIFRHIGGYDENIFLDGVDREFCFRLRKENYKIRQISYIKVKQNLGNGKKNIFGIYEHSSIRNYYIAYNRSYFIDKYFWYFKGWKKFKFLYLSTVKQLLSIMLFEHNKKRKVKAIICAIKDYRSNKKC